MEYQKTTGMSTHSLDAASLINVVYQTFCKIKDPRKLSGSSRIRLIDH